VGVDGLAGVDAPEEETAELELRVLDDVLELFELLLPHLPSANRTASTPITASSLAPPPPFFFCAGGA